MGASIFGIVAVLGGLSFCLFGDVLGHGLWLMLGGFILWALGAIYEQLEKITKALQPAASKDEPEKKKSAVERLF